jgi:hypothetical protein
MPHNAGFNHADQIGLARQRLKSPFAHHWNVFCSEDGRGLVGTPENRGTRPMKIILLMALFCAIAAASRRGEESKSAQATG